MSGVWHGRDWQDYCVLLLQRRYAAQNPHSLQLVPDRHQGDLGIEAFSLDGAVYQCYAAEEPLSVKDCYEKQRDKLTTDLGKLKTHQSDLTKMLGSVQIKRYVFMVHRHDSRLLITHASNKSVEVRSWQLPFVHANFRIVIETDDDYGVERTSLFQIPKALVPLEPVEGTEKDGWVSSNEDLRLTAAAKLDRVISSSSTRDSVLDALTLEYLKGENALERLRTIAPDVHAGVLSFRSRRESLLALDPPTLGAKTYAPVGELARNFAANLRTEFVMLDEELASTFAWAAIADWLMRCPLDFEDAS